MKRIVKAARKTEKKSPAIPSIAEIASGTETDTSSAPDWTFSAAPESPSHESSSDSRRPSTIDGRSCRKSRAPPTSGTSKSRKNTVTATAVPSTVTVAASPRESRVFAITNVGVSVTPELGLFLARLNFGLMFGRFALDAEHRSIWFDETLLGDQFSDEELRFAIQVVSSTADDWDDRLKQMFGGATYQEVLTSGANHELPRVKPGEGGYL